MSVWIMAGVWGFVAGPALLLGAAAGYCISGIAVLLGYVLY
jgi:hypothetical protein